MSVPVLLIRDMFIAYSAFEAFLMRKNLNEVNQKDFRYWFDRQLFAEMTDPKEGKSTRFQYRKNPKADESGEILIHFKWLAVKSEDLHKIKVKDMKDFKMTVTKDATAQFSASIEALATGDSLVVINQGTEKYEELNSFLTAILTIVTVGIKRATKAKMEKMKHMTLLPSEARGEGLELAREMGLVL